MTKDKKRKSYKTLYSKHLDSMIHLLYDIEYNIDNRIEAVWRQQIELEIKKLRRKKVSIEK